VAPNVFCSLMFGSVLTKWTVRLALACYVAYLASGCLNRGSRWANTSRLIWTIGCVLFDVHVACAFHFRHHWSHAAAWQHTAERTLDLLGVAFGGGIFFSYLFSVLWLIDVLWLWISPCQGEAQQTPGTEKTQPAMSATAVPQCAATGGRTPLWRVLVHIFMFFIVVNGAIVFEAGPTRWFGLAALLALGILAGCQYFRCKTISKTNCLIPIQSEYRPEAT